MLLSVVPKMGHKLGQNIKKLPSIVTSSRTAQWANYRGQADIRFFKNFDFMVDMALFNIQANNKIIIFPFSKNNVQKF
jgi:hypothetical protein